MQDRRIITPITIKVTVGVVLLLLTQTIFAAPIADLWDRWTRHNAGSQRQIDHTEWSAFLRRNVRTGDKSGINLLSYETVSQVDRRLLVSYLDALQRTPVSTFNRNEQQAYWINLYNAYTVKVVLDHWPVNSIREINISGLFRIGPWDAKLIEVEGEQLSLNDIEHRILRPIWKDPRLHFALNCASIGCPNLQSIAFMAENNEQLLERGAEEFLGHARAIRFEGDVLVLSSIFDWYSKDFGVDRDSLLAYIARYTHPVITRRLVSHTGFIRYHYDWSLNRPS